MLEIFVISALVLCLCNFLQFAGLVKMGHVYWLSVCIGVVIFVAYGGDDLKTAVTAGAGSGLCADAVYTLERLALRRY